MPVIQLRGERILVVLLEFHDVRTRWWFRKRGTGQITVNKELVYQIDLDGLYDPNKARYVLARDGVIISRRDLKADRWEILRDGAPLAIVDERYGMTYGSRYYDLFWEGTVYKSFPGMQSLSDSPTLLPSDSLWANMWPSGRCSYSALFGTRRWSKFTYRDDLDPDIAAILALHEYRSD